MNSCEKNPDAPSVLFVPSVVKGFAFSQAQSRAQIEQARELFREYEKALGVSLCFQGFDKELASLPGSYSPPSGRLLLASHEGQLAGCVALHELEPGICEMKRLFLRLEFRGKGLGRTMIEVIVNEARAIGYQRLRLDTIEPLMRNAVALYRRMGFREIQPYCANPFEGALYMELTIG